jgi:hypothetical protein
MLAFSLPFLHLLTQTGHTTPMPSNGIILAWSIVHTTVYAYASASVHLARLASSITSNDAQQELETVRASSGKRTMLSEKEFADEPGKRRPGTKR